MKWNDVNLPYFGEKKVIIHKYILSATKDILSHFDKNKLSSKYIVNYIKNDAFWDVSVLKNQKEKAWLLNEINENPYLIPFLITEIEKIIDFPDMYVIPYIDEEKPLLELKSEEFGKRIFNFIKENETIPHFYFSQTDKMKINDDIHSFIQNESNCIKYKSKSNIPPEFERTFTIANILEKFIGIKCKPSLAKNLKPFLTSTSHDVDLMFVQWGNFPAFSTNSIKPKLICLVDEFSIYILGIADEKLLLQYSSKDFLFSETSNNTEGRTAFYGFQKLKPFSFSEIDKYKKENDA